MERRRQVGRLKSYGAVGPINVADVESRSQTNVVRSSNCAQEVKRFSVATEDDVLSVVHHLTSGPVSIRGRPTAQPWTCLEHDDARPSSRQSNRRAQTSKATADDDGVVHRVLREPGPSSDYPELVAASSVPTPTRRSERGGAAEPARLPKTRRSFAVRCGRGLRNRSRP